MSYSSFVISPTSSFAACSSQAESISNVPTYVKITAQWRDCDPMVFVAASRPRKEHISKGAKKKAPGTQAEGEWGVGSGRSELEIDKILRVVAVAVRAEKEHDGDQDEIDGVAQDEGVVQFLREFPVVDKPVGGKQGENA